METPLETLPDDELIAASHWTLPEEQHRELVALIEAHHERTLSDDERARHDTLMHAYRWGLIRKAHALQLAVERGLVPQNG